MLFSALGFATIESIDYSDYEGATHVFDLNQPDLPDTLKAHYDVVLDSGTLEHVFHVPNALTNIGAMTKIGGRIILQTPSSNHFDHGFYMFSPTLFFDYFTANRFKIESFYIIRYSPDPAVMWDVYQYHPRDWDDVQCGGLDGNPYLLFIVATKTAQSTSDVIPQQGFYANSSPQFAGARIAGAGGTIPASTGRTRSETKLRHAARSLLTKMPFVDRIARRALRRWRKMLWSRTRISRV